MTSYDAFEDFINGLPLEVTNSLGIPDNILDMLQSVDEPVAVGVLSVLNGSVYWLMSDGSLQPTDDADDDDCMV